MMRTFWGVDAMAARTALAQLDQFYCQHDTLLATQLLEKAGVVDVLQRTVIALEETMVASAPGQVPPGPDGPPVAAVAEPLPAPPALTSLRSGLFGFTRPSVDRAWELVNARWQEALKRQAEELAVLEQQRLSLEMRMIEAQERLGELQSESPPAPALEPGSAPSAVDAEPELDFALPPPSAWDDFSGLADELPLRFDEAFTWLVAEERPPALLAQAAAAAEAAAPEAAPVRPALQRLAPTGDPAAPGASQRPRTAWRPGMVESGEAAESLPVARRPVLQAVQLKVAPTAAPPEAVPAPTTTPAPVLPPAVYVPAGLDSQLHAGLNGRLEVLFQRFLTGKVLGADLVLPTGQVLAPKGSAITAELARRAEEHGVLPAMITHMTIPGMAAD